MSGTADQELADFRRVCAELQRANSELRTERDAALAELKTRTTVLAQRHSEYNERIDHQSAVIDVRRRWPPRPVTRSRCSS